MFMNQGMLVYVPTLMFILALMGWFSSLFYRKQLLLTLLSLEFIILALFIWFIMVMSWTGLPLSVSFFILVLGACEASLGLALLISMARFGGSDLLHLGAVMKC